ncbi:pseudouridine synthase [Marinagarivorans algicola]|uniref:pseudouridine synthase n=1 Tax=Marinagarivorans algicola TaxID=1513270 RepID=UPI0009E9A1C7|nr:pseudouridine synthase [Marinagarivorans algicola]
MPILLLVNKPFQTLCQFTDNEGRATLSHIVDTRRYPKFYTAGRLDYDSEGLLALTNNGRLQNQLANPQFKLPKTYWVQVEGAPNPEAIAQLAQGITLKDGPTKPCTAKIIDEPNIWARTPPIRQRENSPTHWLEIVLKEGRNRQVRRMTAAVGLPTLRLIRSQIGPWGLEHLTPGQSREVQVNVTHEAPNKNRKPKGKASAGAKTASRRHSASNEGTSKKGAYKGTPDKSTPHKNASRTSTPANTTGRTKSPSYQKPTARLAKKRPR